MKPFATAIAPVGLALCAALGVATPFQDAHDEDRRPMQLGAFSVSLAVKDLEASRGFYQKLGFEPIAGDASQNWLVLQNGTSTIGLFQGMFEKNILTFNPGWTSSTETLTRFEDVREIQRRLESLGLELTSRADESTTGPASLTLVDPDGNTILIDQHVPSPEGQPER